MRCIPERMSQQTELATSTNAIRSFEVKYILFRPYIYWTQVLIPVPILDSRTDPLPVFGFDSVLAGFVPMPKSPFIP